MFTADAVTQLKWACFSMLKIDGILNLTSILQWMSAKLQRVTAVSERICAWSQESLVQSSMAVHRMRESAVEQEDGALNPSLGPGLAWGLIYVCGCRPQALEKWHFFLLYWMNAKECREKNNQACRSEKYFVKMIAGKMNILFI